MDGLTQRLQDLLLDAGQSVSCEIPALAPGMDLKTFLERRREQSDGAPLMADVQVAVKRSLDLKLLEQEISTDPQITAVLIAAANSAAQHHGSAAQTLAQAA